MSILFYVYFYYKKIYIYFYIIIFIFKIIIYSISFDYFKMSSSCESNVTTFDTNWSHDGKPITEFIGIELCALFSGSYGDDNEHETTLFSLKNEEFTPQNLREKIEENLFEVVEQQFHSADVYFRLWYKSTYGDYTGISGTPGINSPEICSLFGPDYFNELISKFNGSNINKKMICNNCDE